MDPTEPIPAKLICDICGQEDALGVASSGLGPFSQAVGPECLRRGVEPVWLLEFTMQSCGGLERMVPGFDQWATWHDGKYQTVRELLDQGVISEHDHEEQCEKPEHPPHSSLEPCWECQKAHEIAEFGMVVTELENFHEAEEVEDAGEEA